MANGFPITHSFESAIASIAWDMVKNIHQPPNLNPQQQLDWYQAEFLKVYTKLLPEAKKIGK